MTTIDLITLDDPRYERVWQFAHTVYSETLDAIVSHRPPYMYTAFDGNDIVGCLGLNDRVVSTLFRDDVRFQKLTKKLGKDKKIVDQLFFAVRGRSVAVPVLIAVAAAHAEQQAISHIVYAGIDVSCRTVERLGILVTRLGPTRINFLPPAMQSMLRLWHRTHAPITCVLATAGARNICAQTLDRHACRIQLAPTLRQSLRLPAAQVA